VAGRLGGLRRMITRGMTGAGAMISHSDLDSRLKAIVSRGCTEFSNRCANRFRGLATSPFWLWWGMSPSVWHEMGQESFRRDVVIQPPASNNCTVAGWWPIRGGGQWGHVAAIRVGGGG